MSLHQHSYSFKGDVLIIKNCTGEPEVGAETRWFAAGYFRVVFNLDTLQLQIYLFNVS